MTRMEKWKDYRNEIYNENLLLDELSKNSEIINVYKKKINSINPNILNNIDDSIKFAKIISKSDKCDEKIRKLNGYINFFDTKKMNDIKNELVYFKTRLNKNMIINEKNEFNEVWLNQDNNYVDLKHINAKIANLKINKHEITSKNVSFTEQDAEKNDISKEIEKIKNIDLTNIENLKDKKKYFIGLYITTFILILICLILLVIIVING